jgi:hypothetical protein
VRPTAAPKVAIADPIAPPLGTLAAAGDPCPQSGWWQCSEGSNGIGVLGGQRQYIKQGQRMPQALLLPPQTLWEKMRGVQSSFESKTRTVWKMVDRRSRERIAPSLGLAQAKPGSPGALAAMTNQGAAEKAAIGSYVTTGSPCLASGWWRCEDSQALDGTRWFAEGSLLPAATFAVPPGVIGKSAAAPKVIQRRGRWVLVRLAQAPKPIGNPGEAHGPTTDQTKTGSPDGRGA